MKRVRMLLAYDGTNYCGWQFQPNGLTIEEVLKEALSKLLGEPIVVIGASRTDSGVHAEGNVVVFDTSSRMPADKICFALNQRLPEDIRVLQSEEVPADWHPRKKNCIKTYEYRILNRKTAMPTKRLYSHFCYFPLDVEQMKEGARFLLGEHDFKSFCTVRGQAEDTVRTIYGLELTKEGDMITLRISGNGFVYNMVRIIVGTLMKVGMGVYPPKHVAEILRAKDRQTAGPTAPARGLTLVGVEYEKELRGRIAGENEDWSYELIQTEILEKKKAYVVIKRCKKEDFDRLLMRVTHQAVRNGAAAVFVCDKEEEGRIVPGKNYGYYQFCHIHDMLLMEKCVKRQEWGNEEEGGAEYRTEKRRQAEDIWVKPIAEQEKAQYCRLANEIFFTVPNSATLSSEEITERISHNEDRFFWILCRDEKVGILILVQRNGKMEIDQIGISENYRGRGAAAKVLDWVEKWAAGQGLTQLSLLVSSKNEPAVKLYQRMGYEMVKIYSRWYGTSSTGYFSKVL